MAAHNYIIWDLGATKCAAALVHDDGQFHIQKKARVELAQCQSLSDLTQQIESQLQTPFTKADAICIAGAGQYNGEELCLQKPYPFPMTFAKTAQANHWPRFHVIHDYAPIVCRTFVEMNEQAGYRYLNTVPSDSTGRRVAFGVGTGLGVKDAAPLENGQFWLGCNEMGHIGLTTPSLATSDEIKLHQAFCRFLHEIEVLPASTPITYEMVLSGNGLSRIYQFFYGSDKKLSPKETAEFIAQSNDNQIYKLFAWYLGCFIATVQLTFMPTGGIYINGGVIHRSLQLFSEPYIQAMWRGIKSFPAYWNLRQKMPLIVMEGQDHAFLGGAYYITKRITNSPL